MASGGGEAAVPAARRGGLGGPMGEEMDRRGGGTASLAPLPPLPAGADAAASGARRKIALLDMVATREAAVGALRRLLISWPSGEGAAAPALLGSAAGGACVRVCVGRGEGARARSPMGDALRVAPGGGGGPLSPQPPTCTPAGELAVAIASLRNVGARVIEAVARLDDGVSLCVCVGGGALSGRAFAHVPGGGISMPVWAHPHARGPCAGGRARRSHRAGTRRAARVR